MHKPFSKIFLLLLCLLLVLACTQTNSSTTQAATAKADQQPDTTPNTLSQHEDNDNTCTCTFDRIGKIRSGERLDLLVSGKGWNHTSSACSYTWVNFMLNELLTDDSVTDFRIHLVDLEKEQVQLNKSFLDSKTFKDNLIATYAKQEGKPNMRCGFDPNRTGKYPKPDHWID